tara:strand:- start:392 stop:1702 length:1311 start_codon:yes stop_codon:yes gene_type:complete
MKKNFFSTFLIFISILLLILTIFKSEIKLSGNVREDYYLYYIISICGIIFSYISFYFSKKIRLYISIIFFSSLSTFYLFEGYISFKQNLVFKNFYYKIFKNEDYDLRSRIEVYLDYLKKDKSSSLVYSTSYFKDYDLMPLGNKSHSKTLYCNENGYFSSYKSDRYGFNNPDNVWDKEETEYLIIGDSFAHGACVNKPNDIGSNLRRLSGKNVINIGFGANGPLKEYASLREYYPPNVDKLLWFYYENDLRDLNFEKKNKILLNYYNDINFSQNLKKKQYLIDIQIDNFNKQNLEIKKKRIFEQKKKIKIQLINFLKLYETRKLLFNKSINIDEDFDYKFFKNNAQKILEISQKNNSKLYFIFLPSAERYRKKPMDNASYNEIKTIIKNLNIEFIDLHEGFFIKEKNPLKLFSKSLYPHYNEIGYDKVSSAVYELIK